MTEKRFLQNPYLKTYQASVIECVENRVVLDCSIFAPEAGGQSCDLGTINQIPLKHVSEENGILYHLLEEAPSFREGETVTLTLDWERRFDHMQNHCGEHILSGLLFTQHQIRNKGFHLGSTVSTIDVDYPKMPKEMVEQLEKDANDVVFSNQEVQTQFFEDQADLAALPLRKELKVNEDIYIVSIEGVDCVACCCPHPKTTAEVGLIKIVRFENYKGMTRLYFKCGKRALSDYRKKHDLVSELNIRYSSEDDTLLESLKIQDNKANQLKKELNQMKKIFAQQEADKLISEASDFVYQEYENATLDDLKFTAKKIAEQTDLPVVLSSLSCLSVLLTHSGKSKMNCGQIVKEFACGFGGKGGGSNTLAQALFTDGEVMRNFIKIVQAHLR